MTRFVTNTGANKNGSTSIRHSLVSLGSTTHLSADTRGRFNHGPNVHTAFANRPERHPRNRRRGLHQGTVDDHVRQMRSRTFLISGEPPASLEQIGIDHLMAVFDNYAADIEIAVCFRLPAGFMSSSFQQYLKSGKVRRFEPAQICPGYRSLLEKLGTVLGRGKVRLWKFEPSRFPQGSAVRDFCNHPGIDSGGIEEDRETDAAGEAGLLRPMPGAAGLLARALDNAGHESPGGAGGDINPRSGIFLMSRAGPRQNTLPGDGGPNDHRRRVAAGQGRMR